MVNPWSRAFPVKPYANAVYNVAIRVTDCGFLHFRLRHADIYTLPRIHVCPAHISRAHRYACMTIGVGELEWNDQWQSKSLLIY